MENEENRGLIHKKLSEDKLISFCWFSFGALSLFFFSLILLVLRVFLENSWRVWHTWILEQEGKGREGKYKRTWGSTTTTRFSCRYLVACMFTHLVFPCMEYACGLLVMICH